PEVIAALERAADRIRRFAAAQRTALIDVDVAVDGGRAGARWIPVEAVGAYAPGGRYPLPSSVLMTVVTARVAGVRSVWVASPRPTSVTLAAAAIAGADGVIAVGGAQAIAALAFGAGCPRSDVVVGPGNRWVTAAKKIVYGEVGIDGLAGPSEVLVLADDEADPRLIASDLVAQAEHDPDAVPMVIATSASLLDRIDKAVRTLLREIPTRSTAEAAMSNGFAMVASSIDEAVEMSDVIGPEHLSIHTSDPRITADRCTSYGSVFIGSSATEAFADYGIGPNHVLPTSGTARFQSGLSVGTFLRNPTWLRVDDPSSIVSDTDVLARVEGLHGHARAAIERLS
ncbi:MAG: histidinol dehydrogenase, partial [Acidimicrobiia bacterium]|nr:histidinol dehydrogenase [Acidimicrobiia bacterium]